MFAGMLSRKVNFNFVAGVLQLHSPVSFKNDIHLKSVISSNTVSVVRDLLCHLEISLFSLSYLTDNCIVGFETRKNGPKPACWEK